MKTESDFYTHCKEGDEQYLQFFKELMFLCRKHRVFLKPILLDDDKGNTEARLEFEFPEKTFVNVDYEIQYDACNSFISEMEDGSIDIDENNNTCSDDIITLSGVPWSEKYQKIVDNFKLDENS